MCVVYMTLRCMGYAESYVEQMNEKIAMTHRAFKGEVLAKLVKIVEQVGGRVEMDT